MKKAIKYSVVVPAFCEEKIIGSSLRWLSKELEKDRSKYGLTEVVVVATNGGDDTAKIATDNRNLFAHFQLLEPANKVGKGRDVRKGILAAKGDYILFLDADMATPPNHIYEAFNKLIQSKSDLIIANRPLSKIHNNWSRRIKSIVSNYLIRILALPGIKDSQCGFKAFKRDVALSLFKPLQTYTWGFDVEILVRAKTYRFKIETLYINDWYDPKEDSMGLVGESNLHAYIGTLKELITISYKRLTGAYKKD